MVLLMMPPMLIEGVLIQSPVGCSSRNSTPGAICCRMGEGTLQWWGRTERVVQGGSTSLMQGSCAHRQCMKEEIFEVRDDNKDERYMHSDPWRVLCPVSYPYINWHIEGGNCVAVRSDTYATHAHLWEPHDGVSMGTSV